MMGWLQELLGWHSIIDWLTAMAVLLVGVIAAIIWLGLMVRQQFRRHDMDLRAEVEKVNAQIKEVFRL